MAAVSSTKLHGVTSVFSAALPLARHTVPSASASAGGLNLCDASRAETACRAWRRRQPDGTISLQINAHHIVFTV
jgi:hypothetical protein